MSVAEANVNRTWALAGTSIAIFTFTLVFLYPRFSSGAIDSVFFQIALTVIGFAIFSFVFSGICYYALTLALSLGSTKAEKFRRSADTLWVIGFSLLVLEPSLILLTVGLVVVAVVYLILWISYFIFNVYVFTETQSWLRNA